MSSSAPPFPGYIYKDAPRTATEAVSRDSLDQAIEIAKAALQAHIVSYFEGEHSKLFHELVPFAVHFDLTNLSITDRTQIPIQVARRYSDLKMRLPTFLISSTGILHRPTSISDGIEASAHSAVMGRKVMRMVTAARLPIDIVAAALDLTTANRLIEALRLIFGPLRQLTTGAALRSANPADGWEIRLPLNFNLSGPGEAPVSPSAGDPKDRLYSYTLSLEVEWEDSVELVFDAQLSLDYRHDVSLTVSIPDQISFRHQTKAEIQNLPVGAIMYSDNSAVALVDGDGYITPRRLGKFRFLIVDGTGGSGGSSPRVYYEKEVEVVSTL